ncbi:hypothetical protein BpHYR1_043620 [Brachionus plicatilis]|uniref:Uncharacterized protein n=1 Tax=Brachionus plicatilis TaxID=10195 RepID=A0A3M7QAW7_BRAPC|nr:hypothetical protein BpHYR1_043620 [Brachionus plicatilis]
MRPKNILLYNFFKTGRPTLALEHSVCSRAALEHSFQNYNLKIQFRRGLILNKIYLLSDYYCAEILARKNIYHQEEVEIFSQLRMDLNRSFQTSD